MPVICTVFMHKSYWRGFRSNEKEDGRCLDINLLRVYNSPLEIYMCYASVWQRRWKQRMPASCLLFKPCHAEVCQGSDPAQPAPALLELSSLAQAPVGAAN